MRLTAKRKNKTKTKFFLFIIINILFFTYLLDSVFFFLKNYFFIPILHTFLEQCRAYSWFKKNWITIKKILSDNGLEFTTHHIISRPKHSFEIMLKKLNIEHKYTRVRRPQTNWKIERFWKIFEEQFFRKYDFTSTKDFNIKFRDWLVYYNTKRKYWWIKYITPMQKLENLLENNKVCI